MSLQTLASDELSILVMPENGAAITQGNFQGKGFLAIPTHPSIEPIGDAQFRELGYDGSAKGSDFRAWESFQEKSWHILTSQTSARMGVFSGISCIKLRNSTCEIEISWDAQVLPHLWVWEEMAYTKEHPWNGEYWALGIEPSSAADGMGLGGGSVRNLQVNEKLIWSVNLKIQKRAGK